MEPRVTRISIAPVKALALVHPDEVELGPAGVEGNRRFWLVDEDGRLLSDKRHGRLVLVRADWDERTRRLALTFPGGRVADGVVEPGEPVDVSMYGEPLASRRVAGEWSDALSDFVGRHVSLLWAEDGAADRGRGGGAMTLVSQASLDRLSREAGAGPLDARRFRMLFEIDGVGPHEEDEWLGREVAIGDAVVRLNGDVGRCVITTLDPDTGVRTVDTLAALARYRPEGQVERLPFGVFGSVVRPGRVRVGDRVDLGV